MNETYVYILHAGPDCMPFYVGESKDPATRFKQHVRDAANPLNEKEAYTFLRENNITKFDYEVVPNVTEAELVCELTLLGFKLYNSNSGITKSVKKARDDTFQVLNRQAECRLNAPRKILHGPAQQLTKSEIVAQRIRNEVPTLDQLLAAEWRDCPIEQLGVKAARTGTHAKYAKFGDISVYVGFRKNGTCMLARNTRTGKDCVLPTPLWWGPKLDKLFNVLAETMAVEHYWDKVYSF
jgi:hypothetical protein